MGKELLKLAQAIAAALVLAIAQQLQSGGALSGNFLKNLLINTVVVRLAGYAVQKFGPQATS